MDSTKICMIGLLCTFLCLLLGEVKSSFSVTVKIACSILVFLFAASSLSPVVDYFKTASEESSVATYTSLILRGLGISLCSQISSDICRDAGNSSLASGIELVSKAEILLLSLPLIKEIIKIAEGVMS